MARWSPIYLPLASWSPWTLLSLHSLELCFHCTRWTKRDGALTNCLGGMIWLRAHSDSWRRMQHRRFCRAVFGIFWRIARDTRLVFSSRSPCVPRTLRQNYASSTGYSWRPASMHCHLRNVNQNGNPTCQQECQLSLTCSRQTRSPLRLLFAFFCWAAVILMLFQPVKCLCTK